MGGLLKDTITPLNTQNYGGAKQNETEKTLVETSKRGDIDILYEVGKENSENDVSSKDEAGEMQDLNISDTPVWLKDKLQTNSDNNNSRTVVFSLLVIKEPAPMTPRLLIALWYLKVNIVKITVRTRNLRRPKFNEIPKLIA